MLHVNWGWRNPGSPAEPNTLVLCIQDEVRDLGRLPQLNVPEAFVARHPFPGQSELLPYSGLPKPFAVIYHLQYHQPGSHILTPGKPELALPLYITQWCGRTATGPGLGVRVLGDVTAGDALEVLRQVISKLLLNRTHMWSTPQRLPDGWHHAVDDCANSALRQTR